MFGYSVLTLLAAYFGTAIVFFALDFLWLTVIAIGFYRQELGSLILERPNMAAAGAFYLFYVAGIAGFAVLPAVSNASWLHAVIAGVALGLLAYGTYDMTNLATLNGWSWKVSAIDLLWGGFLTGISALAGYWVTRLTV